MQRSYFPDIAHQSHAVGKSKSLMVQAYNLRQQVHKFKSDWSVEWDSSFIWKHSMAQSDGGISKAIKHQCCSISISGYIYLDLHKELWLKIEQEGLENVLFDQKKRTFQIEAIVSGALKRLNLFSLRAIDAFMAFLECLDLFSIGWKYKDFYVI